MGLMGWGREGPPVHQNGRRLTAVRSVAGQLAAVGVGASATLGSSPRTQGEDPALVRIDFVIFPVRNMTPVAIQAHTAAVAAPRPAVPRDATEILRVGTASSGFAHFLFQSSGSGRGKGRDPGSGADWSPANSRFRRLGVFGVAPCSNEDGAGRHRTQAAPPPRLLQGSFARGGGAFSDACTIHASVSLVVIVEAYHGHRTRNSGKL